MSSESPKHAIFGQLAIVAKSKARWIIVSDEVGMSVVPATKNGRIFKDLLGDVNQMVAAAADRVYLMSAGIPLQIK